jgi:hypothetical protein
MQKILRDTSLVCATFGDEVKIRRLLESINYGSCIPSCIIIISFKDIEISDLVEKFKSKEVRFEIIYSLVAAQVHQRNLGIARVRTEFIIQCDDDIVVLLNSLEVLHKSIIGLSNTVCSPKVIMTNGVSIYQKSYLSALLNKLVFLIFNIRWPKDAMLMSNSGRNYSPILLNSSSENEWLPSCLMYKTEIFNLATTFEDKSGKGYFEDIIFTHSLFKNGIKLKITNDSIFLHPKIESLNYSSTMAVFKKQLIVCRIFNLSTLAAYFDICLYIIFLSFKKFKRCIFT